ncbi:MAG TPA: hypothetical protein VFK21_08215 [Gammaproteobacteria bacterium]|nr:hypothetical protein [Gammaproteobacteria bacterium]
MDDQSRNAPPVEPAWTLIRVALLLFGIGGFTITTFLLFAYGWSPALLIFMVIFVPPLLLATAGLPVSWFATGTRIVPDFMPGGAEHREIRQVFSSALEGDTRSFDFIFNVSLVAIMLIVGFSVPTSMVNKIQVVIMLFVASLAAIYALQPGLKNGPKSLSDFLLLLAGGAVYAVLSMRLEPIWMVAAAALLRGHLAEAGRQLNSQPHANFFLAAALMMIFVSLVGMFKLGIVTLLNRRRTKLQE